MLEFKIKAKEFLKKILNISLNAFNRTDKSRNRTSTQAGLGIGLSILKQIVDGYHLQMKVESELNEGSVFILHIPLAQSKES
ncbi:ATP-binding protein [Streptococcus pyogenes]